MLDPKICADILYKHFAEVTPEEFLENLKKSSPELFEDDAWLEQSSSPEPEPENFYSELVSEATTV
ncbi:MAG: hypothetical protein F6J93_03905 [Oscillatoria sp. SIO1A7]|nr:hypothetical protein [Oscillatoria sp. SIO1A7]